MYFLLSSTRSLGFMRCTEWPKNSNSPVHAPSSMPRMLSKRGFARARRSHDGDEFALADIHIDAAQHIRTAVAALVEFFQVAERVIMNGRYRAARSRRRDQVE